MSIDARVALTREQLEQLYRGLEPAELEGAHALIGQALARLEHAQQHAPQQQRSLRIVIGDDPDPDNDEHACEASARRVLDLESGARGPCDSMHIERRFGQWQIADAHSSNLGPIYVEIPIVFCPWCGARLP